MVYRVGMYRVVSWCIGLRCIGLFRGVSGWDVSGCFVVYRVEMYRVVSWCIGLRCIGLFRGVSG